MPSPHSNDGFNWEAAIYEVGQVQLSFPRWTSWRKNEPRWLSVRTSSRGATRPSERTSSSQTAELWVMLKLKYVSYHLSSCWTHTYIQTKEKRAETWKYDSGGRRVAGVSVVQRGRAIWLWFSNLLTKYRFFQWFARSWWSWQPIIIFTMLVLAQCWWPY